MGKTTSLLIAGFLAGVFATTVGFATLLKFKPADAGSANAATVLKLGHSLPTNHPVHRSIERMKDRLVELSGGTMTIDIYPGSQLGSEEQSIEMLQNGSLAMTKTSAAALEGFIPQMAIFSLPYLFRDEDHFWAVLNEEVGKELLSQGEAKFLRGLCYYDAGSRNFYTKSRPVESPDDLAKLKIRVMNSATAMNMVEAFGASPTPIAWGELYTALAQGTVDGAENNLPSFSANKHYEVCKHFTLDGHSRVPDILLMGTKAWNKLSAQQQDWLAQAANDSATYQRQLWAEETLASRKLAESEGVTVYEVDTAAFAEKVQPMLDRVEDADLKRLLVEIREVE
jgi:tripartite ATP-independent transporter DctP family solute receptor